MVLSQEHVQTLLMAIARVEVLEDRLTKKHKVDSEFLPKLLAAKQALIEATKEGR